MSAPGSLTVQGRPVSVWIALCLLSAGALLLTAPNFACCDDAADLMRTPTVDQDEARRAVVKFSGNNELQLSYEGLQAHGPLSAVHVFTERNTGGRYLVDAFAGNISHWYLGTSEDAVPEGEGRDAMLEHERLLIDHYFSIAYAEMVEVNPDGYCRRLGSGAVSYTQTCGFGLSEDGQRIEIMTMRDTEPAVDTEPLLSYEECLSVASELVHDIPGVRVRPTSSDSDVVESFFPLEKTAKLYADEIGLQHLTFEYLFRMGHDGTSERDDTNAVSDAVLVSVDARTGHPDVQTFGDPAVAKAIRSHIGQPWLELGSWPRVNDLAYPPMVVKGRVYFCWRYLGSRLWPGELSRSPSARGGVDVFHVAYDGTDFLFEAGSRSVVRGDERIELPVLPILIHGELWLPGEAIEFVTDWRVSLDTGEQIVTVAPPRISR